MPRYHFNVRQGEALIQDLEGEELPDLETAEFEARMTARELLMQAIVADDEIDGRVIEIADTSGKIIETMKVKDLISRPPR
jgi:hypothetical protein